jgi:hypothetical protein
MAFRYYVRIETFRRLLPDDYLTGFVWIVLLATTILWHVVAPDMYELMGVAAMVRMPSEHFVQHAERYMKGSLGVLFVFYVGLWTVKVGFLGFFYRLGSKVTYYCVFWWVVTCITVACGAVCVGDIQYHCLADSLAVVSAKCLGGDAIQF